MLKNIANNHQYNNPPKMKINYIKRVYYNNYNNIQYFIVAE